MDERPADATLARMDIRVEVICIDGVWTVSDSGPGFSHHASERAALAAGIDIALQHHIDTGGDAAVHLWKGAKDAVVFDTRSASAGQHH